MPNRELSNKWMEYAKTDYDVAVHDTTFHPLPIEIICYHCQQAGEKALKAILVYHGSEIQKTHDLSVLLNQCKALEPDLPDLAKQAVELSNFAVVTRYPSSIELEEADMKSALLHADTILKATAKILENKQCRA